MVHYEVIVGIRKQSSHYLLPFIIVYAPTMGTEALIIVIHMLHIHSPTLDFAYREEANGLYIFFIVVLIITLIIQGAMLAAVCQCRYYLSCKEMHLAALKVAESSVVFVSPPVGSNNPPLSAPSANGLAAGDAHSATGISNGNPAV
ncbi:unnamed protein product [Gongylonema pulchrum]|uniref:Uncharacterized protein n=1 Tax=Gongylonema pulchrum TaxID=637853 RepID=A0A183DVI6_9BILA|nr:unnamed protein product [Gongylonema pulchrum]